MNGLKPEASLLRDWRRTLDDGGVVVLAGSAAARVQAAREACRELAAELRCVAGSPVYESRSATTGALAVAMCRTRAVGVDVEALRPAWVDQDLLDQVLHPEERAAPSAADGARFFDLWTRKEAVLKALGTGLALAPRSLECGWQTGWSAIAAAGVTIHVRSLPAPEGTALAIAAAGARPPLRGWLWQDCQGAPRRLGPGPVLVPSDRFHKAFATK